jgi:hypothetical protein
MWLSHITHDLIQGIAQSFFRFIQFFLLITNIATFFLCFFQLSGGLCDIFRLFMCMLEMFVMLPSLSWMHILCAY